MSTANPTARPGVIAHADVAQSNEPSRAAAADLLRLTWGIHVSRCVYAVAELGIADLLAGGPVSSDQLAQLTDTHEPSLYRVLRLLAALHIFEEHDGRSFSLTVIGEPLCTDATPSMRSWATLLDAVGLRSFEHILDTIRTGTPGFNLETGIGVFEFLAQHPEKASNFDAAMAERTAAFAPSVADCCDFSDIRSVVDVGGGNGTLLVEILRRHPHLSGVLFEAPTVAARADAVLDATDIAGRCELLAGDFFEQIPGGADCYLLANVLHDWDDQRSIEILRNCRRAMPGAGRVLIIERLIPNDDHDPVPTLLSDINMLIVTGGQERTDAEYGNLLERAGLRLTAVQKVAFPYGVIEAQAG